jgi:O-succinylbenzoic acid--CoA ligase
MTLSVIQAAREVPDRHALVVGARTLTFRELGERIARRIAGLRSLGVPAEDGRPVAVVGVSDVDTLELVLALIEIGQPIAMIHPRLTADERRTVVETVSPVLVVDRAFQGAPLSPAVSSDSPRSVDDERCLAVLFSSGTTGRPKGIELSRRAFIASAIASEKNLGWLDDDRWLLGLPIAHVGGLSILTRCLLARRTVIIPQEVAEGRRLDAAALAQGIAVHRVTLASLVPTQLEWLLADSLAWSPPPHLRAVLLGGAAARPALLERAVERRVPVLTTYGLTEACSQVTTQALGTIHRGELGSGRPISGVEVRIVDGAIQVRGPTLMTRYVPADAGPGPDADGWFHTDDLGRLDAAGNLHVLGRRSDLVITGGENVFPAEIEAVLERCPGIAAACVFGVPDDTWGELVAVAIVPERDGAVAAGALEEYCRQHLATHRRPRRVAYLAALAVTPAGKLDRRETARRAAECLQQLDRAR